MMNFSQKKYYLFILVILGSIVSYITFKFYAIKHFFTTVDQGQEFAIYLASLFFLKVFFIACFVFFIKKLKAYKYLFFDIKKVKSKKICFLFFIFFVGSGTMVFKHISDSSLANLLLLFFDSLAIGFFEELACRILLFFCFLQLLSSTSKNVLKASLLSSLFFAVMHLGHLGFNPYLYDVLAYCCFTGGMGLVFSGLLFKIQNIYIVAFLHGMIDFFNFAKNLTRELNFTVTEEIFYSFSATWQTPMIHLGLAIILSWIGIFMLKNESLPKVRA